MPDSLSVFLSNFDCGRAQRAISVNAPSALFPPTLYSLLSALFQPRQTPIRQDDFCRDEMVSGHAIQDGMRAGGIVADHAAQRGAFRGGRVGAEDQTMFSGSSIERGKNEARFHGGGAGLGVNVHQFVEPARAIQDQGFTNSLPGQRRTGAARQERYLVFGRQFDSSVQVVLGFREGNAERLDLVDGGVGAVENTAGRVEADLARKMFAQVGDEIRGKGHAPIVAKKMLTKCCGIRSAMRR